MLLLLSVQRSMLDSGMEMATVNGQSPRLLSSIPCNQPTKKMIGHARSSTMIMIMPFRDKSIEHTRK